MHNRKARRVIARVASLNYRPARSETSKTAPLVVQQRDDLLAFHAGKSFQEFINRFAGLVQSQ
jgi:hypothetical protein